MVVHASTAVLAGICGIALLYASWRAPLRRKRLAVTIGWGLIAASFWYWSRSLGAEFGVVVAATQLSIVAFLFVLGNRHIRRSAGRTQEPAALNLPRFRSVLHHSGRFMLVVPLAACAATTLVLGVAELLPWNDVNRLAFAVLTIPLIWGVLAYWAALDARLLRPALGLVAGGALGAVVLYT